MAGTFYTHGLVGHAADTGEAYVVFGTNVALEREAINHTFNDSEYADQIEDALTFEPDLVLFKVTPVALLSDVFDAGSIEEEDED